MRVWVDLTNSPHVLVMRPLIELLHADGHEVSVTARDFAQTLELCERFGHRAHRHRPPPRRAASIEGAGLASRSLALIRWARRTAGAGGRPSTSPSATAPTTSRVAAAALRIPSCDDVRLRVGDGPAPRQLPPGARGRRARCDPPERLARYGARGKLRAYEGLKEEYYLADFEPDEAVLERARPRPDASRWWCVRTPPDGVALPPLPQRPVRRRAGADARRGRRGAAVRGAAAGRAPSAPSSSARPGLARARARDRRAVADRVRGPRDLGRGHHEPRGRRTRHAGLHDLRGPDGGGRRTADRGGPACGG